MKDIVSHTQPEMAKSYKSALGGLGLSSKLLFLTIFFILLAEIFVFAPSVGRAQRDFLLEKITTGHLALLSLEAARDNPLEFETQQRLLTHAEAILIAGRDRNDVKGAIFIRPPSNVTKTINLMETSSLELIWQAFQTLWSSGQGYWRIVDMSPRDPDYQVEVVFDPQPLTAFLRSFALRVTILSLVISLVTGSLIYLALNWLIIRPVQRLTDDILAFRHAPDDPTLMVTASNRLDELGQAHNAFAQMQATVRMSLQQQSRLAALGTAVSKMQHDLRNILSTALLLTDRLEVSEDPAVRKSAPRLVQSVERAIDLCTNSLNFTRNTPATTATEPMDLAEMVDTLRQEAACTGELVLIQSDPPALIKADKISLFRVLQNLMKNAFEAGAQQVTLRVEQAVKTDGTLIWVQDNGVGLPPGIQENLFVPFRGSTKETGSGLGLSICQELMRNQNGDIRLHETDAKGTVFRLYFP